jgi:hypothetical protein
MTATNHALTGTLIGLLIDKPYLALPLAFLSHFICDAIPHYGSVERDDVLKTKTFKEYLVVEAGLCALIVLVLALTHPPYWQQASVCAFLAASPDLYWFKRYKAALDNKKWKPDLFGKFASDIQWFQTPKRYIAPIGIFVELFWFSTAILLILPIIGLAKI